MSQRAVYIDSYFSLPTDLAGELRGWPEFLAGEGYETSLRTETEDVSTSLRSDEGRPYVLVIGRGDGPLFYRVLGQCVYALAGTAMMFGRASCAGPAMVPLSSNMAIDADVLSAGSRQPTVLRSFLR